MSCKAWSAITPSAAGSATGVVLPLQSDSSIAVSLDTGILLLHVQSGAIQHAVFSKGKHCACFTLLLHVAECNLVERLYLAFCILVVFAVCITPAVSACSLHVTAMLRSLHYHLLCQLHLTTARGVQAFIPSDCLAMSMHPVFFHNVTYLLLCYAIVLAF